MANALSNQMFDKELEASPLILIFSGFDHAPVILKTFPTQWIPKELPQWCFRFNSCDPVWDASTELRLTESDLLDFKVSDHDAIGKADLLGRVTVPVAKVWHGFEDEVKLLEAGKEEAFLKLKVEQPTPAAAAPRAAPELRAEAPPLKRLELRARSHAQNVRRQSIESGLTIREVRQLSVSELERWLEEERLRRQRRQTQRERERSVSRGPRIEEEEGHWWQPGESRECPKCGSDQPELSKFCGECGAPWNWTAGPGAEAVPKADGVTSVSSPAAPLLADELTVETPEELPEEPLATWADSLDSPGPPRYEASPAAAAEVWTNRDGTAELRPLHEADEPDQRMLKLLEGPYAYLPKTAQPRMDPWQSRVASYGVDPSASGEKHSWWHTASEGAVSGAWSTSTASMAKRSATHFGLEVFQRFLQVEQEPRLQWLADEMMHAELPESHLIERHLPHRSTLGGGSQPGPPQPLPNTCAACGLREDLPRHRLPG
ncbi:unnamed protein product [Durusdinium trenchii]|uniref:C2 domain-containing protein n=1 Tax=Durusdinium trenchii TaxID=1381693 RepID=A0ABP0K3U4_9DINO